ncbi:MAG TPA: septum formation initiator family protein, partial [Longimicrobiales bacterium]|nr:septum formation initiator family protein [Longimicrobiales bacterium]
TDEAPRAWVSTSMILRHGRLIFLLSLCVAGYFVYTAALGLYRNEELSREEAALRAEVHHLREQRLYLQGIRDYVETDEFVEREARSKLGYIGPGEVPFVITSPSAPAPESDDAETWWERLFPR